MAIKYIEVSSSQNGTYTDITDYIALGGFKVQRNDVDSDKAGRSNITGVMTRMRVTTKQRIDCNARPLTQNETQTLLALIKPEYVYVNYLDPEIGWRTGVKMYSNNVPATSLFVKKVGTAEVYYWTGITFPLIEC